MNDDSGGTPNPLNPKSSENDILLSEPDSIPAEKPQRIHVRHTTPDVVTRRSNKIKIDVVDKNDDDYSEERQISKEPDNFYENYEEKIRVADKVDDANTKTVLKEDDEFSLKYTDFDVDRPEKIDVSRYRSEATETQNKITPSASEVEVVERQIDTTSKTKKSTNKAKPWLFAGMVICLLAAIACIVATILVLMNTKNQDVVGAAISKVIAGDFPNNITVNGSIDINDNSNSKLPSRVGINFTSSAIINLGINSTDAKMIVYPERSSDDIVLDFKTSYSKNGDFYVKFDGGSYENEETDEILLDEVDALLPNEISLLSSRTLPGPVALTKYEWVKIPANLESKSNIKNGEDIIKCTTNFLFDLSTENKSSSDLAKFYNENPFMISTDTNNNQGEKYQVKFDKNAFSQFVSKSSNISAIKNLSNCFGYKDVRTAMSDIATIIESASEITMAIDKYHNIKNFDIVSDAIVANLAFSYPDEVDELEQIEYKDISDAIIVDTEEGKSEKEQDPPTE